MNDEINSTLEVVRHAPVVRTFSQPYWEATRERKLVLQYCTDAQRFQWPPGPVSRFTGRRNLQWREVAGGGELYSYTITRVAPRELRGHEPFALGAVLLDEEVLMLGTLVDSRLEELEIGIRVEPGLGRHERRDAPADVPARPPKLSSGRASSADTSEASPLAARNPDAANVAAPRPNRPRRCDTIHYVRAAAH